MAIEKGNSDAIEGGYINACTNLGNYYQFTEKKL